jgi:hypothetical protein
VTGQKNFDVGQIPLLPQAGELRLSLFWHSGFLQISLVDFCGRDLG